MPLITNYRKTRGIIERGTRALQPLASDVLEGTIYFVTDELVLERSNGTTWQTYSPISSSGIIDRVVETTTSRTIANTQSIVVADYFAVEGSGSLIIEGDGALWIG